MASRAVHLLGRRGLAGVALGLVAGVMQSAAESGVGLYLQAFLVSVGVAEASMLPASLKWAADLDALTSSLVLLALGLLRSTGAFISSQVSLWTSETIVGRVRALALHELVFPPRGALAPNSEAQFRQGELAARTGAFANSVGGLLGYAVQALVFLVLMFASAWRESVVALVGVALVAWVVRGMQSLVRRGAVHLPPLQRAFGAALERVLRNRVFVTLLRMEAVEEETLLVGLTNVQRGNMRNLTAFNLVNAYIPAVGIALVAAVVWSSQQVFQTRGLTLLTFLYLMFRFIQCGQNAVAVLTSAQVQWPYFKQAMDFADAYGADVLARSNRHNAALPLLGSLELIKVELPATHRRRPGPPRPPRVEVRDAWFSYAPGTPEVLRGLTVTVEPGRQLALVGPSGVGKSTLLLLLLGLHRPTRGQVLLDGRDAPDWRAGAQPRIGYVGAEPFLVMGSMVDNLNYGLSEPAPLERCMKALRFARLEEFATPEKIQRMVSEDLQGLSTGQKQRLCLARAWLAEPDLLVLDEATANVDEATERYIADALGGMKGVCTTILVTHRRGLLVHADQVVDMAAMAGAPADPSGAETG